MASFKLFLSVPIYALMLTYFPESTTNLCFNLLLSDLGVSRDLMSPPLGQSEVNEAQRIHGNALRFRTEMIGAMVVTIRR